MGDPEPLTNGPTADKGESSSYEWDHAWSFDEIRKHAEQWSLGADVGLLKHLQDFSERLMTKAQETSRNLSELSYDTHLTDASIQSVTDHFLTLSDSQFIENRVYDEDDSVANKTEEKEEQKPKTKEEREAELIPKYSEAVKFGLSVLEDSYDVLDIKAGDSDIDSDDEVDDELNPDEVLLEPTDPYVTRPLPHLIGSRAFYEDDDVGVGDLPSSDEAESVGSLSESEEEVEKPPTVSDASSSEFGTDDLSDDESIEDVPINRKKSVNSSSDYTSSDNEDIFANKQASSESEEDEQPVIQPKAKSRADSQLSKKKQKPQKKKREPERDMFGDDGDDDNDDLFAPSSGMFSSNGKSLFGPPKDGGLFEGVEGSFSDESSSDEEAKEEVEEKKPSPPQQKKKKNEKKPPTGGISLFGGAIKKGFFNGEEPSDHSDESDEDEAPPTKPTSQSPKGLFEDSESDEEDLFADAEPPKKAKEPSPQVKKKQLSKSQEKQKEVEKDEEIETKPSNKKQTAPKSGGLFDESEEEEEEEDLFKESKPKEVEVKSKKPVGGVSMFGAGGNMLQDAINKTTSKRKDSFSNFGSDTSKQSSHKDKTAPSKSNASKKQSLFSASDSDDGGLFTSAKKTPVAMATSKASSSKSGSLFGESDSDNDSGGDLFGKANTVAKKSLTKKSGDKVGSNNSLASQKSKSSVSKQTTKPSKNLFDDDGDDLFGPKKTTDSLQKDSAKKQDSRYEEFGHSSSGKISSSSKAKQSTKTAIEFDQSDLSDDDGLFSSKPPPLPSDSSSESSIDLGPPRKVTPGRGMGLFGGSESDDDDDLFAGMSKAKQKSKPAKTEKPVEKKVEPSKPAAKKPPPTIKKSSLFGDDEESDNDEEGDLFSKPPPLKPDAKKTKTPEIEKPENKKPETKLKAPETNEKEKPKEDSLFDEKPDKKSASLFESDSEVEIKVDGPPDDNEDEEEFAPKKKLAGAVSMFGAGGGELLAAIQKKRSASQRSNRLSENEMKTPETKAKPPAKDTLFGDVESDNDDIPDTKPEPEVAPKPKDKKVLGNATAKPFQPSLFGGSEKTSGITKVAAPGKSGIGKLQSNLAINPAALLPGAAPSIKSSVDIDAPLESVTKSRSRGQAGRRPPSRQARRKVAAQASQDEQSSLFDVESNNTSTPITSIASKTTAVQPIKEEGKKTDENIPKSKNEAKKKDVEDDFLDSLLSPSSSKVTKAETSKTKPASKSSPKATNGLPSIFDDGDDMFAVSTSTKKKSKPKQDKDLFDSKDILGDDLFDITTKPKTKKAPKKVQLEDDLFSDVLDGGKTSDLFETNSSKKPKHGLFADDLFANDFEVDKKPAKKKAPLAKTPVEDDFDDLFGDASPKVTAKKSKKTKSEKKAVDLFEDDGDIFGDLPATKPKTKKGTKKVDDLFADDGDLFSSETQPKKSTKKKSKPKDDDDIFNDPLSALS